MEETFYDLIDDDNSSIKLSIDIFKKSATDKLVVDCIEFFDKDQKLN